MLSKTMPAGWFWSDSVEHIRLQSEYERELPPVHLLATVPVQVVAHRDATDDVLLKHSNAENIYSVVHLSWLGSQELPHHPTVEFTGSFDDFVSWEQDTYASGGSV